MTTREKIVEILKKYQYYLYPHQEYVILRINFDPIASDIESLYNAEIEKRDEIIKALEELHEAETSLSIIVSAIWQVIFWYPKDPFKGRSWFTDMYPPKIEERLCKDYFHEVLNLDITQSNQVDDNFYYSPKYRELAKEEEEIIQKCNELRQELSKLKGELK
jgi:hypothetical protein